jgi:hypothetical protein
LNTKYHTVREGVFSMFASTQPRFHPATLPVSIIRVLGVLGLGVVGCVKPVPPTPLKPLSESDLGGTQWLVETEKSAEQKLKGIDTPKPETWQIGSEVLYSVRIEGRGAPMVRFVHFILKSTPLDGIQTVRINPGGPAQNKQEVFDIHDPGEKPGELQVKDWSYPPGAAGGATITSGSIAVWMGLYDERGKRLESHYALLPEAHLREGLTAYCESAPQDAITVSDMPSSGQSRPLLQAQAALYSFGAVANSSSVARPLVKQLVPRSTQFGIWLKGRPAIDFEIGRPTPETRQLPALASNLKAWQIPLTISMNGEPTLQCRMTVVRPVSPFDLGAGILAFEGRIVDRPERRFQMHLISAKRPAVQPTSLTRE